MAVQQLKTGTGKVQTLGSVPAKTLVKINIDDQPFNFIVANQGIPENSPLYDASCDGTWVLMEDIYENRKWNSSGNNLYHKSEINDELNNTFWKLLDRDIQDAVLQVKIPYNPGSGSSTPNSGSNGLSCKIFLLSIYELGWSKKDYSELQLDGAKLDCFQSGEGSDANALRVATLDDNATKWWTRSPWRGNYDYVHYVDQDGSRDEFYSYNSYGIRPAFILPKDLYVLEDGTVTVNQPPTAPGSIDVTGVVSGGSSGSVTVTLTAATDPDGTVASYRYERQIDGGEWTQFADVNSLTQTDTVGEDWGTVAYRACAVDNLGIAGPYVTGETFTVNSGWVTIGGPAEDMGSQPKRFDFEFSVSVSGVPSVDAITVSAARDGVQIYSGTPSAGEQISVPIDTRLLGAGEHVIEVQASKDDYLPASRRYTFTVPAVTIPAGGTAEQAQGPDGRPVFHKTLARLCIGTDGVDIQAQVDALTARVKTLEG